MPERGTAGRPSTPRRRTRRRRRGRPGRPLGPPDPGPPTQAEMRVACPRSSRMTEIADPRAAAGDPPAARGAVAGPDGGLRCPWGLSAPEYVAYHDNEWGRPLHGDQAIFERLCLEAFQSGLSWLTILRKRENFRKAFAGFDIPAVAAFTDADGARLLAGPGIVANRAKI